LLKNADARPGRVELTDHNQFQITTQAMEQVFTAPTLEEANRKADDWWMKQKGVRQIRRAQISGGWGAPPAVQVTEWTVTIEYEPQ
jgi:hypothetical protein